MPRAAPSAPDASSPLSASALDRLSAHWLLAVDALLRKRAASALGVTTALAESGSAALLQSLASRLAVWVTDVAGRTAAAPRSPTTPCVACGGTGAGVAAAELLQSSLEAASAGLAAGSCEGTAPELAAARAAIAATMHALAPALPPPPPPPLSKQAEGADDWAATASATATGGAVVPAGGKRPRDAGLVAPSPASRRPRVGASAAGATAAASASAAVFSRHPVINRWAREDAAQDNDGRRRGRRRRAAGGVDDFADLEDFIVG